MAAPRTTRLLLAAGLTLLGAGLALPAMEQVQAPAPVPALTSPSETIAETPLPSVSERAPAESEASTTQALPGPAGEAPAPPTKKAAPPGGRALPESRPVNITIPSIGVESSLLELGLTKEGRMEVPPPGPTYDQAGWYEHSPTPGELGPAVIAGHVDSAKTGPSVFFHLGSLRAGALVHVERSDGTTAVFEVQDVLRFEKAEFPSDLVYGDTTFPALRLLTCGGPFDEDTGHYRDNVVVTARLVS